MRPPTGSAPRASASAIRPATQARDTAGSSACSPSATRGIGAAGRTSGYRNCRTTTSSRKAYLKRHGITKRVDVNTIANRTLISNETNGKIKDKAPADYLTDDDIFPSGAQPDLLDPHFIDDARLRSSRPRAEELSDDEVADLYAGSSRPGKRRSSTRSGGRVRNCGSSVRHHRDDEPDEAAADVQDGTAPVDEDINDLVPQAA